ncbi:hypothetical protein MKZ38_009409 [Zalerion maritima]|uniref:Uncharacterized protein n=1 Tax=Zalerion maritima TaxID=339359 RepID=A0AAD5RTC8_9PEZI|nr:hypothetical protein MKZ38_009409 [Zalerion maritima]
MQHRLAIPDLPNQENPVPESAAKPTASRRRDMLKEVPIIFRKAVKGIKKKLLRKWKRHGKKKGRREDTECPSGCHSSPWRPDGIFLPGPTSQPHTNNETETEQPLSHLWPHPITKNHSSTVCSPPEDSPAEVVASVSYYFAQANVDKDCSGSKAHLIPKYKYFGRSPWHPRDADTKTVNSTVPSSVIRILRGKTPPATVRPPTPVESENGGCVGGDDMVTEYGMTSALTVDDGFPSREASAIRLPRDRTGVGDVVLAETRYDFHPPGLECSSSIDLARGTREMGRESIDTFTTAQSERRQSDASGKGLIPVEDCMDERYNA